jgi:hypothetical protein
MILVQLPVKIILGCHLIDLMDMDMAGAMVMDTVSNVYTSIVTETITGVFPCHK